MRGLPWPYNETKIHGFTSFTEFQAILSPHHILTANVDVFPMQKRFADINALVPQSASSDYHQHGASLSITDANQLSSGALLTTVLRYTRFDSSAHGQGSADMLVTPEGWGGNFFNAWSRTSNAFEAIPTLQLPQKSWLGHHDIRFGMDISHRSYNGRDQSHAIELLRQDQSVAERIDFAGERAPQRLGYRSSGIHGRPMEPEFAPRLESGRSLLQPVDWPRRSFRSAPWIVLCSGQVWEDRASAPVRLSSTAMSRYWRLTSTTIRPESRAFLNSVWNDDGSTNFPAQSLLQLTPWFHSPRMR